MRNFLTIFFVVATFPIYAHNVGTICGTVSDGRSCLPLIGVNIQIKNSLIGTTTDLKTKDILEHNLVKGEAGSFNEFCYAPGN